MDEAAVLRSMKRITHEIIEKNNITFVNDSICTIPEATIACYKIFEQKNIYGILGGYDRQQDYSKLTDYIKNHKNIKFLALLGQTASRIAKNLQEINFNNFKICDSLKDCFDILYQQAKNNNNSALILSPAATSYDMYKNFTFRGQEFKNCIDKI